MQCIPLFVEECARKRNEVTVGVGGGISFSDDGEGEGLIAMKRDI